MKRQGFLKLSALLVLFGGGVLFVQGGEEPVTHRPEGASTPQSRKNVAPQNQRALLPMILAQSPLTQTPEDSQVTPGGKSGQAAGGQTLGGQTLGGQGAGGVGLGGMGPGMMGGGGWGEGGSGSAGGGGMGGMGGIGGMGMGYPSQFGYPGSHLSREPMPLVIWSKPETPPAWLNRGRETTRRTEAVRDWLDEATSIEVVSVPLRKVLAELFQDENIEIEIDMKGLESAGQTPETEIVLSAAGTRRVLLNRILEPLGCDYIVREGYLQITSQDDAKYATSLRTYDLTHVLPNNSPAYDLGRIIQNSIAPDFWESGDATLSILGSLMVVRANEAIHLEIERLLSSFTEAKFREPENVKSEAGTP